MNDTVDCLLETAWNLRDLQPQESRGLVESVRACISTDEQYAKRQVVQYFHDTWSLRVDSVIRTGMGALKVMHDTDSPIWLARLYGRLGFAHHYLGDVNQAIEYWQKQLECAFSAAEQSIAEERFCAYLNMGWFYLHADDNELSHSYFSNCYTLLESDSWLFGYLFNSHATCYLRRDQPEVALELARAALKKGVAYGVTRVIHYTRTTLFDIYLQCGEIEKARACVKDAFAFAIKTGLPLFLIQIRLAELHLACNDFLRAKVVLDQIKSNTSVIGSKHNLSKYYRLLSTYLEKIGEYQEALVQYKLAESSLREASSVRN